MMMIVLRLLSLLGLKSRWHRPFSPRLPNKVFFQGRGRGVAGFVDSGAKTLVPSASNRSTPEWTRVDSHHGRADQERLRAKAFFQPIRGPVRLVWLRTAPPDLVADQFLRAPQKQPCQSWQATLVVLPPSKRPRCRTGSPGNVNVTRRRSLAGALIRTACSSGSASRARGSNRRNTASRARSISQANRGTIA